jgi:cytidylate kinase
MIKNDLTMYEIPILTIDGTSGVGKGTAAAKIAQTMDWNLLDSGAIYRSLAVAALKKNIELNQEITLAELATDLDLRFEAQEGEALVFLNNQEITKDIRSEEAGNAASKIAVFQLVRTALLARQRAFAQPKGLVADGRDMGTVVFPEAWLKVFLTASIEERAKRRYKQLKKKGIDAQLSDLINVLTERDTRDSQRSIAPLQPAADAIIIDTSHLSVEEVINKIMHLIHQRKT